MINSIKKSFVRFGKSIKEGLNPSNIKASIQEMPRMNQVYWSKLITGFLVGMIFGLTNFTHWPAGLTLLFIYIALSLTWFLALRKVETGIKVRQYFTSAIFQYFISAVAIWALIWNLLYVPPSEFEYIGFETRPIIDFLDIFDPLKPWP